IDEASQCDIASAIPLLFRAKRAVIIGDPQQLKHITSLVKATDTRLMIENGILDHPTWGYSTNSLFDAMSSNPIAKRFMLNEHHRSDETIINFSNKHFYDGNLIVATRRKKLNKSISNSSLQWVNISGEVVAPSGSGALNTKEANAIHNYIYDLVATRGYTGTVGVVTPFRKQANRIRDLVEGDIRLQPLLSKADILIDTVHKFQGDERDLMIFSPVISNGISQRAVSFLQAQGNLFNVAITRARSHLVLVGDIDYCRKSGVKYIEAFAKYYDDVSARLPRNNLEANSLPTNHPFAGDPKVSEWEVKFYQELRAVGLLPIPQYSEDKYALDFALFRADGKKLNIEVDGETYHKSETGHRCRSDEIRNQTLIELGWEVQRFWVYQLKEDMNLCVRSILNWANDAATPEQHASKLNA
ncbi:MAG: AAA domain-containing protein, partial [Bdellovibrionales bacterium]